ncbi:MAG: 30S ribosomal protein S17e [Methanobacteriota archaeon]
MQSQVYLQVYIIISYFGCSLEKGDTLGNVRQTPIKKIALELIKLYPDQFSSDDYQKNKHKVGELTDIDSNLIRNRVAGYVTRYLVCQKKGRLRRPISE